MPNLQDFLSGLYEAGAETGPQDEFKKKQQALQQMVNQSQEESQAATQNAGAYSAMGKSLDSMSANKMALGPGFQPVKLGSNANAEGILNAYQGAKATGSADKLKNLLANYKLSNEGEGVTQKFGENRTEANRAGANALAAIMQTGQKVDASGASNEPKLWANAEDMAATDDKKEAADPSYVEIWSKRLNLKRPVTHEEKVKYYYNMQKQGGGQATPTQQQSVTSRSQTDSGSPKLGEVKEYNGVRYRFKGGENVKENWEKI